MNDHTTPHQKLHPNPSSVSESTVNGENKIEPWLNCWREEQFQCLPVFKPIIRLHGKSNHLIPRIAALGRLEKAWTASCMGSHFSNVERPPELEALSSIIRSEQKAKTKNWMSKSVSNTVQFYCLTFAKILAIFIVIRILTLWIQSRLLCWVDSGCFYLCNLSTESLFSFWLFSLEEWRRTPRWGGQDICYWLVCLFSWLVDLFVFRSQLWHTEWRKWYPTLPKVIT